MAVPPDVQRLRRSLASLSREAKDQRWDGERPWRARTHVWDEQGVVVVDLHDLKVALAKKVVDRVVDCAGDLEGGAVIFVTGVGRHSAGKAVLPDVVAGKLQAVAAERGWTARPGPAGRQVLVLDAERAPSHLRGGVSWAAAAMLLFMVLAAVWLCAGRPGL